MTSIGSGARTSALVRTELELFAIMLNTVTITVSTAVTKITVTWRILASTRGR